MTDAVSVGRGRGQGVDLPCVGEWARIAAEHLARRAATPTVVSRGCSGGTIATSGAGERSSPVVAVVVAHLRA